MELKKVLQEYCAGNSHIQNLYNNGRLMVEKKLETVSQRVKYLREISGRTRRDIERNHNIKYTTLRSWELKQNTITIKAATELVAAFLKEGVFCSESWIMFGTGEEPLLLGEEKSRSTIDKHHAMFKSIEFYKRIIPESVFTFLVEDNFSPAYRAGSYLGGIKKYGDEINQNIGSICIVGLENNTILVRKLLPGSTNNSYRLSDKIDGNNSNLNDTKLEFSASIDVIFKA